jgi:hypothetical protein
MESSQFVTDMEFGAFVQDSAAELYDLLVRSYQDYYLAVTADVVASTDAIPLPADFYKLRGVDLSLGGRWIALSAFSFQERNNRSGSGTPLYNYSSDSGIRYRVQGSSLKLTPSENATNQTFRVWYTPLMPALTLDADVFDDQNRWSEYIVVDAAIKALQKEESSTTVLERQKEALKQRIQAMANDRDSANAEVVLPSARRHSDWSWEV